MLDRTRPRRKFRRIGRAAGGPAGRGRRTAHARAGRLPGLGADRGRASRDPTGAVGCRHGPAHLRDRDRVRRDLHVPRPAAAESRRGGPLPVPPRRVLGSQQQRVPAQRLAALPRRGQPPRVRHPRVRRRRPAGHPRRAGERILEGLLVDAETRLHEEGIAGDVYLFKNNTDSAGNSYGCHENYLVGRHGEFGRLADALIPFLVSRQIVCGAGKVLQTPRGAVYCVSQRAEHIWEGVSSATTRSRPIINTRDEPHADAERYRRLHVIVGDSNMSETTTLLKVGATDLVLRMLGVRHGAARHDAGEPDPGDPRDQPRPDRATHGAAGQRARAVRPGDPDRVLRAGPRLRRRAAGCSTTRVGHRAGARPVGPRADRRRDRGPAAWSTARSTGSSSSG